MAFADDCTGMVQDVHDAETFLQLVQDYATAAGLRLNAKKTCIMPFTRKVSLGKLNRIRTSTDYQVLGPTDRHSPVKLLGILQGASITPVERLSAVLVKMRERCAIWKYRARTLRGKVVLLQNIILPLLWYTTSVTHVPPQVLKKVDIIVRNFVHSQDTSSDTACRGKFSKEWIFTGISKGGLGLTPIKIFIQATHLKCLRDGIAAANEAGQAPRFTGISKGGLGLLPALEIFSDALGSLGYGFDILYADMKSTQWSGIPEYWRSTLRLWADLQTSHGTTNWRDFTQFMPLWFNTHFTFGKGKLPLSMVSKETNSALKALGFVRLHDFVEQFGDFATAELLSTLLDEEDFSRPASRTRLIKDTIARFGLIVPQEGPHYGPVRSTLVESACHGWSFGDWDVIYMANRHFVRLLLEARSHQALPLLPLDRLHLASFTPTDDTWCREIAWDQHVLPVCADLKFRLQHNTLGFRYKFAWRTEVDTSTDCVHGCEAIEDAQHLFWLCPIACFQWDIYLAPFADLTHEDLGWRHVMFPGAFQLRTSIVERFGDFAIRATFNIVRCCVLRALWLHRNKRLYNPAVSTSSQFVKHHAAAYIQLHLRQYRRQAWKDGLKKSVKWVDHIGMVLGMVVKTMSDPSTIPTSLPSYSTATESTVSTVSSASPIATETLPDLFRTLDLNRRA
ncbi:hypothetical protein P3T76_016160 [Phytophthora citrophthora]|uniref:Reverse transcriptase domain-containing protein n=1 Tax=Phytophthora citrophthora TaxID=4793 RepID=A0AAD9FY23_9STRA|nr:hypothetical protein P3T76_016160 [Phytophthora citrophthora]